MKSKSLLMACISFSGILLVSTNLTAGDVPRYVAVEFNPLAPIAASRENANGNTTSMWDFGVDFNVNGKFSTGPEIWLGTFAVRSDAKDEGDRVRREDFQYSERHKLDATKINWNISFFESGYSMRGWFIKGGYSYTKVTSRANKFYEPSFGVADSEMIQSNIVDYRHGAYGSFGQRWHMFNHKATISVGLSYTHNFRRKIHVEGGDADAEADYLSLIEQIPDTRLSAKPMPSADFKLGFLL